MAYSSPTTRATGYLVTAANWNEFVNNFKAMAPDIYTTSGDINYATGADALTRLGIGTAGQVLATNSGATAPEWKGLSALSLGGNLIRNFPSLELADDAQPEWWEVTNDPTLHEVDLSGESIAEKHTRALKLTISADGGGSDYAYQDFDEADEPTLDNNVTTVSAGVWVYQKSTDTAGTITLELYDVDGSASLGTATTSAQDGWTWLEIENVTYQDSMRFRITHSANNAIVYFTMPGLNVGATTRPWAERAITFNEKYQDTVLFEDPADTNWADVDFSSYASPLAVILFLSLVIDEDGGQVFEIQLRRNGGTDFYTAIRTNGTTSANKGSGMVMCDDSQIIEEKVNSSTIDNIQIGLIGYWEWT